MLPCFRVATYYRSVDCVAVKAVPLLRGLFIYLFTNAVNVSGYTASKGMMINE